MTREEARIEGNEESNRLVVIYTVTDGDGGAACETNEMLGGRSPRSVCISGGFARTGGIDGAS